MKILEDKAQKHGKHMLKHMHFEAHGVYLERYPLPVGDYIAVNERVADVILRKRNRNIELKKMDFLGTYSACVDSKFSIQEIISDICGKQHDRFRDECVLAQNNGIKLYVLIENMDDVKSIDDLEQWHNPRLDVKKWIITPSGERRKVPKYPTATKGETLAKAMRTMQDKYSCEFLFCAPEESGAMVLELLGKEV